MTDVLGTIGIVVTAESKPAIDGLKRLQKALSDTDKQVAASAKKIDTATRQSVASFKKLNEGIINARINANVKMQQAQAKTEAMYDRLGAKQVAWISQSSKAAKTEADAIAKGQASITAAVKEAANKKKQIQANADIDMAAIEEKANIEALKAAKKHSTSVVRVRMEAAEKQKAIQAVANQEILQAEIVLQEKFLTIQEATANEVIRIKERADRQAEKDRLKRDAEIGKDGARMVQQVVKEEAEKRREIAKTLAARDKARAEQKANVRHVLESGYAISRAGEQAGFAGLAVAAPIAGLTMAASNFQTARLRAFTNTDTPMADEAAMADNVRKLMSRKQGTNHSTEDLFQASMKASNFKQAGQSMADTYHILEVSADAATATFSNVKDTTEALAREMFLFKVPVGQASNLMNAMEVTAARNHLTLEQMVQNSGRLLSMGSEIGLSLNEQIVAYAILTKRGLSASQAVTALRAAEMGFAAPTNIQKKAIAELSEKYKGLGSIFGVHNLKVRGLVGVLEQLHDVYHVSNQDILKLFPDYRKITGLLPLLGGGYKDLVDGVHAANQAFQDNSRYQQRLGEVTKTAGYQVEATQNKFSLLADSLSKYLLPNVTKLVDYINTLFEKFNALDEGTKKNILDTATWAAGILLASSAILKIIGGILQFANGLTRAYEAIVALRGAIAVAETAGLTWSAGLAAMLGPGGVILFGLAAVAGAWWAIKRDIDAATEAAKLYKDASANDAKTEAGYQTLANSKQRLTALQANGHNIQGEINKIQATLMSLTGSPEGNFTPGFDVAAAQLSSIVHTGHGFSQKDIENLQAALADQRKNLGNNKILYKEASQDWLSKHRLPGNQARTGSMSVASMEAATKSVIKQFGTLTNKCGYWVTAMVRAEGAAKNFTAAIAAQNKKLRVGPDANGVYPPGTILHLGPSSKGGANHYARVGQGNMLVEDQTAQWGGKGTAEYGKVTTNRSVDKVRSRIMQAYMPTEKEAAEWNAKNKNGYIGKRYPGMPDYMTNEGGTPNPNPFPVTSKGSPGSGYSGYTPFEKRTLNSGLQPDSILLGRESEDKIAAQNAQMAKEIDNISKQGNALATLDSMRKIANDHEAEWMARAEVKHKSLTAAIDAQLKAYAKYSAATGSYNSVVEKLNSALEHQDKLRKDGVKDKSKLKSAAVDVENLKKQKAVLDTAWKAAENGAAVAAKAVRAYNSELNTANNNIARFAKEHTAAASAIERMNQRIIQQQFSDLRNSGKGGGISLETQIQQTHDLALGKLGGSGIPQDLLDTGDLKLISDQLALLDQTKQPVKDAISLVAKAMASIAELTAKISARDATGFTTALQSLVENKDISASAKMDTASQLFATYMQNRGKDWNPTDSQATTEATAGGDPDALKAIRAYYDDMSNLRKKDFTDVVASNRREADEIKRQEVYYGLDRDAFKSSLLDKARDLASFALGQDTTGIDPSKLVGMMTDRIASDKASGKDTQGLEAARAGVSHNLLLITTEENRWAKDEAKRSKEWERLWQSATSGVRNTIVDGLTDIITGSKKKGEDLKNLFKDIFDQILKMIIKKFVTDALLNLSQIFNPRKATGSGGNVTDGGGTVSGASGLLGTISGVLGTVNAFGGLFSKASSSGGNSNSGSSFASTGGYPVPTDKLERAGSSATVASDAATIVQAVPKSAVAKVIGSKASSVLGQALPIIGGLLAVASLFGSSKKTPSRSKDAENHAIYSDLSTSIDSGFSGTEGMRAVMGNILASQAGIRNVASGSLQGVTNQQIVIQAGAVVANSQTDAQTLTKQIMTEISKKATYQNAALGTS